MTANTFPVGGSRAGIGSVVIYDGGSGHTFMVSNVGAESDPATSVSANVNLTGQSITGSVGTLTPEIDHSITGVAASSGIGAFSIEDDLTLTGVAATSAVGTPLASFDRSVTLSGVETDSGLGTPTPQIGLSLTGFELDSAIESLTTETDDTESLTGVAATSALGSLSLHIDTNPAISGVASSTVLGTPIDEIDISISGVAATSAEGTLTATLLALAGLQITTQLGTISVTTENGVLVGVQTTGFVGQPLVVHGPNFTNINLSGVSITSYVGPPTHTVAITPTGLAPTAQVGIIGEAVHSIGLMLTDVECLVENVAPDDFDVTLRWSDTDGNSWSDSAIRSIGATGAYLTNPQWRRLGMARRQRVFELSWSCPKATALAGATVKFEDAAS